MLSENGTLNVGRKSLMMYRSSVTTSFLRNKKMPLCLAFLLKTLVFTFAMFGILHYLLVLCRQSTDLTKRKYNLSVLGNGDDRALESLMSLYNISNSPKGPWISRLKIFVYDLPGDFNVNLLDPEVPRFYDCRDSMYGVEVLMHEYLLQSPYRTMDPEEADYFFVPLYTSCFRAVRVNVASRRLKEREGILRGRGSSVEEDQFHFLFSALDYIADEMPYWKRQNGRDHVFVFSHDFGACFTYNEEDTYKEERQQSMKALQNSILLQYLGDLRSNCFRTRKDIVIPPLITAKELLEKNGGLNGNGPIKNKQHGLYFRGKIFFKGDRDSTGPGYSRGIRAAINDTFGDNPYFSINDGHSPSYLMELENARLCIAPPGYALWTPRLAESILVGCVPLIIGDDLELPYEWFIDYRQVAVRVSEKNIKNLEEIAKAIPDSVLEKKKRLLQNIWQHFVYNSSLTPNNAFNTIMWRLAMKLEPHRPVGNHEFS
eukprot:m.226521 g.226521  ORF g.226521 m.226521 type:complete len:486 (-) comp15965_c0_seq7:4886-6343(-)